MEKPHKQNILELVRLFKFELMLIIKVTFKYLTVHVTIISSPQDNNLFLTVKLLRRFKQKHKLLQ